MKTTTDFTLGIILALFAYLSTILYLIATPFTYVLSIVSLTIFIIGYFLYLRCTQYSHLTCLLIIPFIIWSILLKDAYIASSALNLKVLAGLGALCTGACLITTLNKYIKLTENFNLKA